MMDSLISRRTFLGQSGIGLGAMAAGSLLNADAAGAVAVRGKSHFKPKAKRVIYLFQSGGPSHIDLFDYSSTMQSLHGTALPDSIRGGQRLTGMTSGQKEFLVCAPIAEMKQRGRSGMWMSDLMPHTAKIADKITMINSMHTEAINHDPGITLINTGSQIPGKPSLGAWGSYGLGSLNDNLPTFVVLPDHRGFASNGPKNWNSAFLPAQHQGTIIRPGAANPIADIFPPRGYITPDSDRDGLRLLDQLNRRHEAEREGDSRLEARIRSYELAARMQLAAPEALDISKNQASAQLDAAENQTETPVKRIDAEEAVTTSVSVAV